MRSSATRFTSPAAARASLDPAAGTNWPHAARRGVASQGTRSRSHALHAPARQSAARRAAARALAGSARTIARPARQGRHAANRRRARARHYRGPALFSSARTASSAVRRALLPAGGGGRSLRLAGRPCSCALPRIRERAAAQRARVRAALTYPAAILLLALAITAALLVWVVPTFQQLFDGFGAKLPRADAVRHRTIRSGRAMERPRAHMRGYVRLHRHVRVAALGSSASVVRPLFATAAHRGFAAGDTLRRPLEPGARYVCCRPARRYRTRSIR